MLVAVISYLFIYIIFLDDYNRVVLEPLEGENDRDYVNASYVDVSASSSFVFFFS